ncbi:MBL fold metallo-hydrolase [bacterium]|nr:MBL fold metallo-hydrolase [bacterium]
MDWTTHEVGENTIVESAVIGFAEANCYIIVSKATSEAAVIDPGTQDRLEIGGIVAELERLGVSAKLILNTHGHPDHMEGNDILKRELGATTAIHELDGLKLTDPDRNASRLFGMEVQVAPADRFLTDDEVVEIGDVKLTTVHTPGHSSGGVLFVGDGYAFTGDTIFAGSVGRTDLPCASDGDSIAWEVLMESIRTKVMTMPDDTILLPGHGPSTTVGHERETNPYVR